VALEVASGSLKTLVTPRTYLRHVSVDVSVFDNVPEFHPAPPPPQGGADAQEAADGDHEDDGSESSSDGIGPQRRTHRYDPSLLMSAIQLSRLLRNPENMAEAVKMALRMAHPRSEADILCADVDSGDIPVPGPKSLQHAWHKLDCLSVLWFRDQNRLHHKYRYLSADASQKKYNYFCMRESSLSGLEDACAAFSTSEIAGFDFLSRNLQCTTLGYGASNLSFKFRNLVHTILLEAGSPSELTRLRESVLSFTSDQGAERLLADCAFATEASFANLQKVAQMVTGDELPLSSHAASDCFMWPNALWIPGHLHLLYNGLENAVKGSGMWGNSFSQGLNALASLLGSIGLRRRFVVTCMGGASAVELSLISGFSKQLLDWRWESLGNLLDKLNPILPTLLKFWDIGKMRGGGDLLSEIDNGHVALTDTLLGQRWLHPTLELLRVISHTVVEWGRWLESCQFHSPSDDPALSRKDRKASRCSGGCCPHKGARGAEMASGLMSLASP
jgi:hypothetical protein